MLNGMQKPEMTEQQKEGLKREMDALMVAELDDEDFFAMNLLINEAPDYFAHEYTAANYYRNSLLALVVYWQRFDIVARLLKLGAAVNKQNAVGITPLMYAVQWKDVPIINLLLKNGADVSIKDKEGNTALHFARTPEVAKILLEADADPSITNAQGLTPLQSILKSKAVKAYPTLAKEMEEVFQRKLI